MIPNTRKFRLFSFLVYSSILIWALYVLIDIMKLDLMLFLHWDLLVPIVIGTFLFFSAIVLYDINRKVIKDLEMSKFKKIPWQYVIAKFCIATLFTSIVILLIKLATPVWAALKIRQDEAGLQVIGGIISGIIGFGSAILMSKYDQRRKDFDEARKYTDQLWFEITHNIMRVREDMKNKTKFVEKLENNCWNSIISSKVFLDGRIKGGLSSLYSEIDIYNNLHQVGMNLVFQEKDMEKRAWLAEKLNSFGEGTDKFLKKLEQYGTVVFGDMVRLGYKDEKDWAYPGIDWKKEYESFVK